MARFLSGEMQIKYGYTLEDGKECETVVRIWCKKKNILENLKSDDKVLMIELYRRLRKYPDYERSVTFIMPHTEFVICSKAEMSLDEYNTAFADLVEEGIINIVFSNESCKVVEFNKSIFITNSDYYTECGTDAHICKGFFDPMTTENIEIGEDNKE